MLFYKIHFVLHQIKTNIDHIKFYYIKSYITILLKLFYYFYIVFIIYSIVYIIHYIQFIIYRILYIEYQLLYFIYYFFPPKFSAFRSTKSLIMANTASGPVSPVAGALVPQNAGDMMGKDGKSGKNAGGKPRKSIETWGNHGK